MHTIDDIRALEILDSRGRPTVKCWCRLASGAEASASVPSGASTGTAEALELRDGDPGRYRGLGCRRAVGNVNGPIRADVCGKAFTDQASLDSALNALDGTPNKSHLGANAILSVSLAFARATAIERGLPLYRHLAGMVPGACPHLPLLTINLFSGGKHAGKQIAIQDVLVVPVAARTVDEGLATVFAVYQAAADLALETYGMRLLRADEGGLAPSFESTEAMLGLAVEAIRTAGFAPQTQVALAVDVASSHFYADGRYVIDGHALEASEMIARLQGWVERYPIVSIEDGLAEEDWEHWPALRRALGGKALVLGDDFLCTNPGRIRRAIDVQAADALLLKVNQIGTLTEASESCRLARAAGWTVVVSARSGETEDDWLADLAVAWGDQIKIGSITQSERLAKYNRLLEIESHGGVAMGR